MISSPSTEPETSQDVAVPSEEARADYGLNATFLYEGNKDLDNSALASKFAGVLQEADNYRQRFMPELQKAYIQYHGDAQTTGKAPWQSALNIPLRPSNGRTSCAMWWENVSMRCKRLGRRWK